MTRTEERSVADLMSLRGRAAVVTGAAGHIGWSICETLAELGAAVCLLDLDQTRLDETAAALSQKYSVPTLGLSVDLSKEDQVRGVPDRVKERFGRMDVLVHCAALVGSSDLKGWVAPFPDQQSTPWRMALEVNLTSAFELSQASAPLLAASGHGSVILVSSIYGVVGPDMRLYEGTTMGNPAAYAASKGGLLQLMRWLAVVLAPDIRVNAMSPGGVYRGQPDSFVQRYVDRTPLKRMAVEEDFKGAIAFLASDLSAYVTGQNLMVDGGWTAW